MFELPEMTILTRQMNETMTGKTIRQGVLGNSPHKFVWYNRTHEEFERLTKARKVGEASVKGRWLFLGLDPGYVLVLGEFGGRVLYHPPDSAVPAKYHLYLSFEDDSFFTATTQMWGAVELYEKSKEYSGKYVKDMKTTPVEADFTYPYFCSLVDTLSREGKKTAKGLLTQDQTIPGLGNAIAQDILFKAGLHPKHPVTEMNDEQKKQLYTQIIETIHEIIEKGGRNDEHDLYNNPGQYVRLMDKNSVKNPCPQCGGKVEKIQYLGGACYVCPVCQK